jgi:hypothetical protein
MLKNSLCSHCKPRQEGEAPLTRGFSVPTGAIATILAACGSSGNYPLSVLLMKHFFSLAVSGLLLAGTAHAQATLHFGPQVGFVRSTVYNTSDTNPYDLSGHTGLEAGLAGSLQLGHFAFQPAFLYSQQGFTSEQRPLGGGPAYNTATTRLDYLRIPLQLAYTQHADGQGLQLFAGPYLGFLLGGRNKLDFGTKQAAGEVVVTETRTEDFGAGYYSIRYPDYNFYGRRLDLGAQVGLGYRLGGALLQVSYSQGLRRVNSVEQYAIGGVTSELDSPNYRNRSVQVSLSYLLGPKS